MAGLRRMAVPALFFAALAAAFMLIRIIGYGELWLSRTQWLVGMAAFGGFVGAMLALLLQPRLSMFTTRLRQGIGAAFIFAGGYLVGFGLAFVFHNRVIAGQYEPHPDHPWLSILFSSAQTAGLFAFSVPRYTLWWMLPLLMLAAGVILPRLSARNRR